MICYEIYNSYALWHIRAEDQISLNFDILRLKHENGSFKSVCLLAKQKPKINLSGLHISQI